MPECKQQDPHAASQPCSQQAINKPAAIRGSRTRQQQAASSSNTDSKQQASSSRRPGGREQAAKTAAMGGRSQHRYFALLQFSAPLSGGNNPSFAILETAACSLSAKFANGPNTSQTGPPIPMCVKLGHRHSGAIHLRSGVAEPSDSDRQPRTTSQVACNNSKKPAKRRQPCCGQAACASKRSVIGWLRSPTLGTRQKYRRSSRKYT